MPHSKRKLSNRSIVAAVLAVVALAAGASCARNPEQQLVDRAVSDDSDNAWRYTPSAQVTEPALEPGSTIHVDIDQLIQTHRSVDSDAHADN